MIEAWIASAMAASAQRMEGWAPAPASLGDVLADEVFRIAEARGFELRLNHLEKTQLSQAAKMWMLP